MKYCVIVAWHNPVQLDNWKEAWDIEAIPDYLILQQDKDKSGCAATKNRGIMEALRRGAEIVIICDDDCYPIECSLSEFAEYHVKAFEPQPVEMYEAVTDPPSRGTPFFNRTAMMPVAATMGFWTMVPDYDAPSQLVYGDKQMTFKRNPMFGRFFPFSGMNCAFDAKFWPHFRFNEEAPRYDDIFMGYALQAEAYRCNHCINLQGPTVRHVRQSNVWANLKAEVKNMERNETEWMRYL